MKITLSTKETEQLRKLFWEFQEAQGAMNNALNEIALSHKINIEKEQWNVTNDFKSLVKMIVPRTLS